MARCFKKEKEIELSGEYSDDNFLLSLADLATKMETGINVSDTLHSTGLTMSQAADRILRDGPNSLSPPKLTPEWVKFLRHLMNPFMLLLDAAGALSMITYALDQSVSINLWLGVILFVVVFFTSLMGYLSVSRAQILSQPEKNRQTEHSARLFPRAGTVYEQDHVRFR